MIPAFGSSTEWGVGDDHLAHADLGPVGHRVRDPVSRARYRGAGCDSIGEPAGAGVVPARFSGEVVRAEAFHPVHQLDGFFLAAFVRKVQAWTGAPKVDLVGHSQGGAINLIYLKDHDGWKNTRRVIGLAAANNSPKFWANLVSMIPGASTISGALIPAGNQLLDPATYARLTPRTYPQVQYSNLVSRFDELAIPSTVAFLPPGPNVRNLLVQQICPNSVVGHVGMIADPSVTQMLLNELDPAHRRPVSCAVTGVPF